MPDAAPQPRQPETAETRAQPTWTALAHLLRPQGRRGELLADLLTDRPEHFTAQPEVRLAPPGSDGDGVGSRPATVASYWLPVGRNQGRVVLCFTGVDSISQAEALAGLEVLLPTSARLPPPDDAEYVDDLIGCTVFDGPNLVGTVAAVEFSTTPDGSRRLPDVAPLLTVVTDGVNQVLIPFVKAFLLAIDTDAKQIHMQLPEGLLDLNS